METFSEFCRTLDQILWGPPMLILILGTGLYLTFALGGIQFRYLGVAFRQAFARNSSSGEGSISPFQSLMMALAALIGIGNIAGIGTALALGGLGSIFWLWVTCAIGMVLKYAEVVLAVRYRQKDQDGQISGGPMYYIQKGLNKRWHFLSIFFCIGGAMAALGMGNLVQSNSVGDAVYETLNISPIITGTLLAIATGTLLFGGIKSIGKACGTLVPIMALFYIGGCLLIVMKNFEMIPRVLQAIIINAFQEEAAVGGFAGASVMMGLQMGVRRGIFSSEAGLGSSPIASAAAQVDHPARQGMLLMAGTFLGSLVICTLTALVLGCTEVMGQISHSGKPLTGAAMTLQAFRCIPGGTWIVLVGIILFAYSTMLGWAYYGEKCIEYLAGKKAVTPYRILFTAMVLPGCCIDLETVWNLADISNCLMAVPNLIALLLLCSTVRDETNHFLAQEAREAKDLKLAANNTN